ncbi:hypothetical protein ABVK25_011893 [Lepraria finkii]|uniref:Uncharacterized protein n=1 Tax=Lepraria finkii TaxID=1340010 RepID=A0ABR4AR71_9LECA
MAKTERLATSVNQVDLEYQEFKNRVLRNFRKHPPKIQSDRDGLLEQANGVLYSNKDSQGLRDQAGLLLGNAEKALGHLDEKRQSGYGRAGKNVQDFANNFAGFIKVYAGFVDVARQAGGPYAEVGYSTLSIFFIVAVRKSENDDRFVDTLKELQNSFPRITRAEDVYSEASVEMKVSTVYRQIISFGREATNYFLARPLERLFKAIVSPAPLAVDKAIEELHRSLAEVNAEIGSLLHTRVLAISTQNQNLMAEVKAARAQVEASRAEIKGLRVQLTSMEEKEVREKSDQDGQSLRYFSRILGEIPGKQRDPKLYTNSLRNAFPEALEAIDIEPGWSGNYNQMTFDLLQSNAEYQLWMNSPGSSLLVFAGSTEPDGQLSETPLCWLSPAALHVVNQFSSDRKKVAFYSCQSDSNKDYRSSRLLISSLLCQLLSWQPEMFRHKLKDFETTVESDRWKSKDDRDAMDLHFDLLRRTLDLFPMNEELAIVLDRLDLCQAPKHLFLKALQGLVRHRRDNLKILVVMDRLSDDYERDECRRLLRSSAKYHSLGRMNWDQVRKSY